MTINIDTVAALQQVHSSKLSVGPAGAAPNGHYADYLAQVVQHQTDPAKPNAKAYPSFRLAFSSGVYEAVATAKASGTTSELDLQQVAFNALVATANNIKANPANYMIKADLVSVVDVIANAQSLAFVPHFVASEAMDIVSYIATH